MNQALLIDNALTERFYGTVKHEEIYLVGNYPDETSAREELGRYIEFYNRSRPHQALLNPGANMEKIFDRQQANFRKTE